MMANLEALEKKLSALEGEVFGLRSELEKAKRGAPLAAKAESVKPLPAAPQKIAPPPQPIAKPVVTAPAPIAAQPSTQTDTNTAEPAFSWEWLIGGSIVGKIGIVTLIISTAFFMVYALDQGWLSEWIRLLTLQAMFAGFAYLSYRLYKKDYKFMPEVLAILALSANTIAIYSAHFVYRFLGRTETMTMMFALMAMALVYARRVRSHALTGILFAGFFALPIVHSRGVNEPKAYFIYLMAVNVLFFAIQNAGSPASRGKVSPYAILVLLAGNALSLLVWAGTYRQYATVALFFCAMTLCILVYGAHRARWNEKIHAFFNPASIIAINFVYALMIGVVLSHNQNFPKDVTAIAMLCQAALNFIVLQIAPKENKNMPATTLVAVLLMALGVGIVTEGAISRFALAIILTLAMVLAGRVGDSLLFFGATIANTINLISVFAQLSQANDQWFLLNFQAATLLFYAVAAAYMRTKSLWPGRYNFGPVLTGVALLASFVVLVTELQRVFTSKEGRTIMITLVFATYAVLLLFVGFRRQKIWFRQAGLFFMGLAIVKFYFVDIWQWDKPVRILAGIVMGGSLVLISFFYEKFRNKFKEMSVLLVGASLFLPTADISALEKFKPNRYKFVKELELSAESTAEKTHGSVLIDAELYRSSGENDIRLVHDGKVLPFARQIKKNADGKRAEKDIPVKDLVTSVDGENNSIYIFENKDRVRLSGLKVAFKETDYSRELSIHNRTQKFQPLISMKTLTVTRKAGKPENHTIDLATLSGEVEIHIRNEDDEPLNLTTLTALSENELIVFKLPENYSTANKKIQIYFGAESAQKPKYDIADAIGEIQSPAEFTLSVQKANPQFKITIFDPPYSVWLFRVVFWLLLVLIAWQMFAYYKRERQTSVQS